MKKIRKWFFKLLTGYDLVEYEDVMKEWKTTLDCEYVNSCSWHIYGLAF